MIWDTSIWRLGCSNHSKIRSAQKCYPCLRYELSPMSPGRTSKRLVGANGFEPSTSWSRTRHLNPINALFGVAYGTRSVISPLSVVPNLYLVGEVTPCSERGFLCSLASLLPCCP